MYLYDILAVTYVDFHCKFDTFNLSLKLRHGRPPIIQPEQPTTEPRPAPQTTITQIPAAKKKHERTKTSK